MERPPPPSDSSQRPDDSPPLTLRTRLKYLLIGPPRDLADRSLYHHLSLIAFLAWVGLGADGLSSSAYGPEEAFRMLGHHTYLAVALAVVMAATVLIISAAYSRVIEHFPHGGGGYVVATKLLGERTGVVSGSALLVDYILTITISIAAAGDALFSFLPADWHAWKLPAEYFFLIVLTVLNLRGARESVMILTPVFLLFILTHLVLIVGGITVQSPHLPETFREVGKGYSTGFATLGVGGMLMVFLHAYSLGGGTYTGIEAVSNGLLMMREPRVQTGKRTMLYMAISLAVTASGLILCYLLWNVTPVAGKTMNAVLVERFAAGMPFGRVLIILVLVSEAAILVVAAQAGFMAGPRLLGNMAVDSWVPRRFAAFSDRLTTQNGILWMGLASFGALLYTGGDVRYIVVMYSINVFLTFALTLLAMCRLHWNKRGLNPAWKKRIAVHAVGTALCVTILGVTIREKFFEGGWITLAVTGGVIIACFLVRRHYDRVTAKLQELYRQLLDIPPGPTPATGGPERAEPVAAVLVAGYGGLGLHTFLSTVREFPGYFKGVVFLSVGVIDFREFKGEGTMEALKASVEENLKKYVAYARAQGIPATYRMAIGTDAIAEAETLCVDLAREFPRVTFFAGKILFEQEKWYQNLLHNETAFAIQKRIQWAGKSVVVIPARLR